jgi:hypothetical protein
LRIEGPLDFALVGILSSLAAPLAEAGISIFALSTYDTDYVLVKQSKLKEAAEVLEKTGKFEVTAFKQQMPVGAAQPQVPRVESKAPDVKGRNPSLEASGEAHRMS